MTGHGNHYGVDHDDGEADSRWGQDFATDESGTSLIQGAASDEC
ncbi:hypothetical protein [Haloarcula sp. CGMCC 1.2071]